MCNLDKTTCNTCVKLLLSMQLQLKFKLILVLNIALKNVLFLGIMAILEGVLAYQMHFRMETTQEPFLPGSYLPIWYRGRNVNKANDGWQTPSNGIVRKAKNEILTFPLPFSHFRYIMPLVLIASAWAREVTSTDPWDFLTIFFSHSIL